MNAKPETSDEPSVVGVRVRPVWSMVLYGLLVLSAGVAFYAQRSPGVDPMVARTAPWIFLVFGLGFSIYRIALVAARRYSPFKAFIQIFLAALFFLLLLFPRVQVAAGESSLLVHRDERVRALAAEVMGWRGDQGQGAALVKLLDDPSPEVREAAHAALVKLNAGVDLGLTPEGWGKRFP
ncbi:MAG: HEAT repeat domain-containing protein [Archangium sp.]|nr:HEAT repeat domain-containing protein [Archangium sp.]